MTDIELLLQHIQCHHELDMKNAGEARHRFFNSLDTAPSVSGTSAGTRLVASVLTVGAEAIRKGIDEALSGAPQRRALAVDIIRDMDPQGLALLTARALIDASAKVRPLTGTGVSLGSMVEDEERLSRFEAANPNAYTWTMRRVKESNGVSQQRGLIGKLMNCKGVPFTPWGARKRLLVGLWLIDQFNTATGLFEVIGAATEGSSRVANYLQPKPETTTWLTEAAKRAELSASEYWPMVCPPRPWERPWGGGYLTKVVPVLPLVKLHSGPDGKAYLDTLKAADLSLVTDAVNRAQATRWAVNTEILAVLEQIAESYINVDGLAPMKDEEIPPRPAAADEDPSVHKSWRKAASLTHRRNRAQRGKRIQFHRTLAVARRFAQFPAIYFPMQLDFRGRVYSVPAFLNPQGSDFQKALLLFAEGKPIQDEEQLEWLAVHGANCYGVDKAPFHERWNWVVDNLPAIEQVVDDTLGAGLNFWRGADSPFCFLAWCYDFVRVIRGGYGTESRIAVALDGSCNGLQHYSAALRDPVGGSAVNLTPSPTPKDIYGLVAARTVERLKVLKDISGPDGELARLWLTFGVDRKITKRSVMTLPYGCTQFSVREFIEDAMQEKIAAGKDNPFAEFDGGGMRKDGLFDASKFLAGVVWAAIGETVVAAREGMVWLQKLAALCAKKGDPISWVTPDGFPVRQSYRNIESRQIETRFYGKVIKPRMEFETDELDRARQRNGVAPNWVHSMDGTMLRLFVRGAGQLGVKSFALIHDSFGGLAADIPVINVALREAFVTMYTDTHPIEDFIDDLLPLLAGVAVADIPVRPPTGTLDLDEVRRALYCFA